MPSSPIHTCIPTSPSANGLILSHNAVGTSKDFVDRPNINEHFNEESEIKLEKIPLSESSLLNDQIQRPFLFHRGAFGKRRSTFSGNSDQKLLCKKRRRVTSVALPTKFLLGGNITDPLNLKSLDNDSFTKKLNSFSPASSPLATTPLRNQVQVMVPPNINDPLNLNTEDIADISLLSSKPRRRKRHRKSRKESDSISDSDKTLLVPLCELPILPNSSNILTLSFVSNFEKEAKIKHEPILTQEEGEIPCDNTSIIPTNIEFSLLNKSSNNDTKKKLSDNACLSNKISISLTLPSSQTQDATSLSINAFLHKNKSNSQDNLSKSSSINSSFSKIVSPVVPQGSPVKVLRQLSTHATSKDIEDKACGQRWLCHKKKCVRARHWQQMNKVKVQANAAKFCYGNHFTNLPNYSSSSSFQDDPRLRFLDKNWFRNKDVLDIGCNVGNLTLFIARYFEPNKIVGLDIDKKLINAAQRQIRSDTSKTASRNIYFPDSLPLMCGPLAKLGIATEKPFNEYPNNVYFFEANFVPAAEDDLETQKAEYDTILCLRVTKWIHLNFGDDGIKMAFKRMHALLRLGGYLIFEPQPWFTYSSSKKITPSMYQIYRTLQMRPDSFCDYLLSKEVGFSSCQLIGSTFNSTKDYRQPMYLLSKGYGSNLNMNSNRYSHVSFHEDKWAQDDC